MPDLIAQGKSKRLLWRVSVTCLVLSDITLWGSGNPSLSGTYFFVWPLVVTVGGVIAFRSFRDARQDGNYRYFTAYVVAVGLCGYVLHLVSPYALGRARHQQEFVLDSFLREPLNPKFSVSDQDRQAAIRVLKEGYTIRGEDFTAPFRRLDYFLTDNQTKQNYDLVFEVRETPQINLLHDDLNGMSRFHYKYTPSQHKQAE
jgi:hypothetical protein